MAVWQWDPAGWRRRMREGDLAFCWIKCTTGWPFLKALAAPRVGLQERSVHYGSPYIGKNVVTAMSSCIELRRPGLAGHLVDSRDFYSSLDPRLAAAQRAV